ncbi:MAG: hypothetical protein AAF549_08610 [Pseudomonadota bacterium]
MFEDQKYNPEKSIQDVAWDVAIGAHQKEESGDKVNNFKNRLIAKFRKSPEKEFASKFKNPYELADAAYKEILDFYYNDFRILFSWLGKWVDIEIKEIKQCPVDDHFLNTKK